MNATETVRVTAEHIAHGQRTLPDACPIALAIRAQHPEAEVEVYSVGILMDRGSLGPALVGEFPQAARDFIEAFDFEDDGLAPFEFELTWRNLGEAVTP